MEDTSDSHQHQLEVERVSENNVRSSFEIMGCTALAAVPNQEMSRPQSRPQHLTFADPAHVQGQEEVTGREEQAPSGYSKQHIPFVGCLFLICISVMTITATGAVITVLKQVGRPVPESYLVGLILSIAIFVFSAAGLGYLLCGSPLVFAGVPQRAYAFLRAIHWSSFHIPSIRWRSAKRILNRTRVPGSSAGHQPQGNLPHPNEFELEDLGNRRRARPPTPYPGVPGPVPPVPTTTAQASSQQRQETLPLGFPVPPSGRVSRINSAVSRLSNISFRSAPRSVSPLSGVPPTPPPKDPVFSRLQSREALLPPTAPGNGNAVEHSDTSASILTTLCDAVQLPSPSQEPGHDNSPLASASSPAAGNTSRDSGASIQSPKPTYPIELASPSRGREHKG